MEGEREGARAWESEGEKERDKDKDGDTSPGAAQSKRPPVVRRDTGNDRSKHQKRVGTGGAGRVHARVPSSKGLHKNHPQSTAKLRSRASSPEPPERPPLTQAHRRTTSDLRITPVADPQPNSDPRSSTTDVNKLKKNTSQANLVTNRNRSHVEIGKRSKSTANIKRSSSQKDIQKLKGAKNQVHFDLGNDDNDDGNDEEWIDASASASPYLSRRGSVVSGGQSPAKPPSSSGDGSPPHSLPIADDEHAPDHHSPSPTQQTAQHNKYITSRLLQRTPSHGAPPQMSAEVVSVLPPSGSPTSQVSHGPPSLYGTPKTSALGGSGPEELVSRFVDGSRPSSRGQTDHDSYFMTSHAPVRRNEGNVRRPKSLGNLNQAAQDLASEDETALAPRSRKSSLRAAPASQSRTQQKLNLQRASSTMEPTQAGPGVGGAGVACANLLVGSTDYEHRDPRIGRLLERTGMEYLVVRRYQNPIARSIVRLSQIPGASINQRIPKQAGTSGTLHGTATPSDTVGTGRLELSQSLTNITQSRPATPRRSTSIRTVGPRSSYSGDDDRLHDPMSGSTYIDGIDDGLSTLLRNLWDKSHDLSASQD